MTRLLAGAFLVALAACADSPDTAVAGPEFATERGMLNVRLPFELSAEVACANGGQGEMLTGGGMLHQVVSWTMTDGGQVHTRVQTQFMGVAFVGSVTGDQYRGAGVTAESFGARLGQTYSYVHVFRLVGPGRGNDLSVHQVIHATLNARGEYTAEIGRTRITCR